MRSKQNQQPTLFDAATVSGDDPAAPAAVGEPDAAYRPGFRWVKRIGWVPEDWTAMTMRKLTTKVGSGITPRGGATAYVNEGITFIRSQNVYPGELRLDDVVCISESQHMSMKATQLQCGDVLLNITGASIGRSCVVPDWLGEANVNQHVCIIRCNGMIAPYFLSALLNSDIGQNQIYSFQAGGNREGLNFDQIRRFLIPLPPPPEQHKIARILGAWDEALAQLDALIAAKEQRLKGLAQHLLTGEVRLPGYEGQPWKEKRIGSLLKMVKRPVDWDDEQLYRLISLRRGSAGLFFRDPLHGRQIKTKNLMTVQTGDFLISKMQVVHGATGVVTSKFDGAHVSGSYLILVPRKKDAVDTTFFAWLAKLPYMYHLAYLSSYGVHIEKMTFNPKLYFKTKIKVPDTVDEQRDIVTVLDTAEAEIDLLRRKRDALAKQKKGLMQRLLTGEVRVIPDPEDVER